MVIGHPTFCPALGTALMLASGRGQLSRHRFKTMQAFGAVVGNDDGSGMRPVLSTGTRADQLRVDLQVVLRHAVGRKALFEATAHLCPVKGEDAADPADSLAEAVHDAAGRKFVGSRPKGRELIKSDATAVSWLTSGRSPEPRQVHSVTSAKPPIADEIAAPRKSTGSCHLRNKSSKDDQSWRVLRATRLSLDSV
jgi:hypothetical protein